jgi:hypothetical protein
VKYTQLKLQPLSNHKFKLLEDVKYEDVVIPKGYKTNGADIPRIFWSIYPPNRSDYLPAVVVHDYLCDKGEYKKADDLFEKSLKELGVKRFDRFVLVGAVRLYHRIKYKVKG